MTLETVSEAKCFGGTLGIYAHEAPSTKCRMQFSVFTPPAAADGAVPVLYWLSGLTCTEDNFTSKAGAYKVASELGLIIVAPDTSPRGDDVPDEDRYDFGKGAGFYVNATQAPWSEHFHMYDYVTRDLNAAVLDAFPADAAAQGIFGHSMGGHGALTIWLRNQDTYKSVSAFAPICAPGECQWGIDALGGYLGDDDKDWAPYDATELMKSSGDGKGRPEILIDQGLADNFYPNQLYPDLFKDACADAGQSLTLRLQDGYDHGYFFIATFMEDHLRHHAAILKV